MLCQVSVYSRTSGNTVLNGEQEKESIYRVKMDKKSVPLDHRLSSLSKPGDANR